MAGTGLRWGEVAGLRLDALRTIPLTISRDHSYEDRLRGLENASDLGS